MDILKWVATGAMLVSMVYHAFKIYKSDEPYTLETIFHSVWFFGLLLVVSK